jgi:preprotein translocase subunit Sec61beta
MAEIITAFVWELLELILAFTGKFVVWALSFGRWRSESVRENESRVFAAAGALSFVREGQRVITATGLVFAGLAFYILLVLLSLVYAAEL